MAYKLGLDCTITVDGVEIDDAKDVTLNLEAGDADVTTRKADGWRMHMATLKDATIEFEVALGGAGGAKLATLYGTGSAVDVEIGGGNCTFTAKMCVSQFNVSEPLEDAETASVTLRLGDYETADKPTLTVAGASGGNG